MFYENCFHAELDSEYAACPPRQFVPLFDQKITPSEVNPALETHLPNGIMVYGSPEVVQASQALFKSFFPLGSLKVSSMFLLTNG